MNTDDALKFTQSLIENHTKKPLNDSQMTVLRGCLEGKLYREIDNLYNFSEDYSKEIGSNLWKILSEVLGVKVTKNNLSNVIKQHLSTEKQKISDSESSPKCNDELRDFVGRDTAINDINDLINEGEKIIVIQASGGVGKSTLAKQYLNTQGFELVLPLEMAKDKENITAVESVVEEWLKQHFQEEPGREFGITLDRLKLQLQTRKIGVLIDNYDRENKWDQRESLGTSFWRLGLLQQSSFSISRIINYVNDIYCLSELYLSLGYTYNLIGLIRKSIEYHKESYRLADKYLTSLSQVNIQDINMLGFQEVKSAFFVNIACCLIDLGELEDAIKILEDGCLFISNNLDIDNHFILESWFLLAFINSCLGLKDKAFYFAEKTHNQFALTKGTTWTQGHSLLFLSLTYKNLTDIDKSFAMYSQAMCYAEESHSSHVKAKALTGLAELYRIQNDFEKALSHHSESIELLDKIGAKCDLAEAYYQIGLTYQKMEETGNSNTNFNEAIRLFNEMEAPKQVEKVEKAKRGNIS
ncbi:tetratricopeptide repeat protein [Anabaena sp. WFMT]|uniref:tetratricopeptide repeat protein n=1 Tax=Anabaena sp. WFMT TaxID=3449730 RepID=UPI003F298F81